MRLQKLLNQLKTSTTFIVIDCAPVPRPSYINALTAADSVMIPVQCEYFALEGLGKLLNTIKIVQGGLTLFFQLKAFS